MDLWTVCNVQIHERDLEMDLCLAILKKLLFTTTTHLKLILMSATMEKDKFQNYFAFRYLISSASVRIIRRVGSGSHVEQETMYKYLIWYRYSVSYQLNILSAKLGLTSCNNLTSQRPKTTNYLSKFCLEAHQYCIYFPQPVPSTYINIEIKVRPVILKYIRNRIVHVTYRRAIT